MKVFVAGHSGMVGSSICRKLDQNSDVELIVKDRAELDLTNQSDTEDFFNLYAIELVILAAAKVGGIGANSLLPVEFLSQNLSIQLNVINAAYKVGVKKLFFLGSSCIYPKFAKQPIQEDSLLTGALEKTNEAYAIAKIAGLKLCEAYSTQYGRDFRSGMPTNLFGPFDNFNPETAHVIPSLIFKIHRAKKENEEKVVVWGTGAPKREFLYVDDLADAIIKLSFMSNNSYKKLVGSNIRHINIGSQAEITIANLAHLIAEIIGYNGKLVFDTSKPDGTPRKTLDCSKLFSASWTPKYNLKEGLFETYQWFCKNYEKSS